LIGLTSLWIKGRPMASPKFNRRRALFVLGKIDKILAWEKTKEQERDVRYVDLGRYLCEVRIGQYWRPERLKSFDEFLERRFPESRRKAYYIMTIHEHLTRIPKRELQQIGWTKARELVRVARADGQRFEILYFKVYKSQLPVIERALETAGLMLGSDKSRGYCLEMICADFLAGANLSETLP
jgi:hypothetical protein